MEIEINKSNTNADQLLSPDISTIGVIKIIGTLDNLNYHGFH